MVEEREHGLKDERRRTRPKEREKVVEPGWWHEEREREAKQRGRVIRGERWRERAESSEEKSSLGHSCNPQNKPLLRHRDSTRGLGVRCPAAETNVPSETLRKGSIDTGWQG